MQVGPADDLVWQPGILAVVAKRGAIDARGTEPGGKRDAHRRGGVPFVLSTNVDIRVGVTEEAGISIAVVSGDSALQLLPFAAPRSSGLWHEVMDEISAEVANADGRSEHRDGPFGPELLAWISPPAPDGSGVLPPQPLRFLGADGPRWFLRGLIQGPAALDSALARPLEDVFAEVVVVRGDHAVPQRHPLEIKLPQEAQQLIEGEIEQQEGMPNPFERGPEITEIR